MLEFLNAQMGGRLAEGRAIERAEDEKRYSQVSHGFKVKRAIPARPARRLKIIFRSVSFSAPRNILRHFALALGVFPGRVLRRGKGLSDRVSRGSFSYTSERVFFGCGRDIMRCKIRGVCLALAAASLSAAAVGARGDVVIFGNSVVSVDITSANHNINVTSLPMTTSDSVGPFNGNSDKSTYSLTGTQFNIDVVQARGTTVSASALSNGQLFFTATDATTSYQLYGSYNFSSPFVKLDVFLDDVTNTPPQAAVNLGEYTETTTDAQSTSSGTFTVGGPITGASGSSTGNLSGLLLAGHKYEFVYVAQIEASPNASPAATATGTVGISFSDPADNVAVAPLPSAAFAGLGLFGVAGCWMLARRRWGVYSV